MSIASRRKKAGTEGASTSQRPHMQRAFAAMRASLFDFHHDPVPRL